METTVTDNAANVVKAISLPGFEKSGVGDTEEDDDDDDDDSASSADEQEFEESGENPQVVLEPAAHDACFAHTLQLVVKDGLKEIGAIKKVLAKVAAIVSHVRKSQVATEVLEGERRLQSKNATRWNSEVRSIASILRVNEDKLKSLDVPHLTAYDRKILQDMVTILRPFQEATDLTQGQNVVTASFAIPCIRGLRKSLQSLSVTYNSRMLHALENSLDERMSKYEDRERFILASILDPRFKMKWCKDGDEAKKSETMLLQRASTVVEAGPTSRDDAQSESVLAEEPVPKKKKESSKLLSYLFSDTTSATSKASESSLQSEISSYLAMPSLQEDDNPLKFWKEQQTVYPHLAKLAARYLSVPASSGPVERLFSIGGKIFRPERCRLTDNNFEKLMNIKCNAHLLHFKE